MLGQPYVRMKAEDLSQFANGEGGYRIGVIEVGRFDTDQVMARYCFGGDDIRGGWTIPVGLPFLFNDPVAQPYGADPSRPTAIVDEDGLFSHPHHDAIDLADWSDADKYRDGIR